MQDQVFRTCSLAIVTSILALPATARADIILPGYKAVSHQLVFADSAALRSNRLVAMPVAGFGGMTEVKPGQPFSFSQKYGTRFYVVPDHYVPPPQIRRDEPVPFPSAAVPVKEVHSVPVGNPVSLIRTTCELISVSEDGLEIRVIDHKEFARSAGIPGAVDPEPGVPISWPRILSSLAGLSLVGLIGCFSLWWRTRRIPISETDPSVVSKSLDQSD